MFNENSGLVKTWVSLINKGQYTLENVPSLFNLQEVVKKVLEVKPDNV